MIEAAAWVAEDNKQAAIALVDAATLAAERVIARPGLGRRRPDLGGDRYRFFAVRGFPYLLVFDAERQPIVIARVVHQSRDLVTLLDE